jgi:hypothetical protein
MLKTNFSEKIIVTMAAILSLSVIAIADQGNWTKKTDQSGVIHSMTITSPNTQLRIESEVEIFLDSQGNPVRGNVKFNDGIERELNFPGEVISYWDTFRGSHALWDYLVSGGKVELFNPDLSEIPQQMYGKMTRVVSKDGNEYIGKLNEFYSNPDWFTMQVFDRSLQIYRHNVSVIQQMK